MYKYSLAALDFKQAILNLNIRYVWYYREVLDTHFLLQICNAVLAARILNATLVLPDLDANSFWRDKRYHFHIIISDVEIIFINVQTLF